MLEAYLTAVQNGESVYAVHRRLLEMEDERHEEETAKINEGRDDAQRLVEALEEDPNSFIYQWANAYLQQAKANEAAKPDEQKQIEARIRKIEAENQRLAKENQQLLAENEKLQRVAARLR